MGLRTIIATDIMLHHVALDDGSRDDAIRQMLNPEYNDPSAYTTFTSPKLVNRQLKSFIQTIQKNFCIEVLKRLHHILRMHKGQQKTRTWMSSFVLMLTMAMCQEELEHSRYLRADGEAKRGEQEPQLALEQARRDVRHADTGFDFLLTLFHCKYSPQKRYVASLVDWMGKTKHVAEDRFLERLCRLGNERRKSHSILLGSSSSACLDFGFCGDSLTCKDRSLPAYTKDSGSPVRIRQKAQV